MLDNSLGVALYQQLYQKIREGILSGRFTAKTRLPSSRDLANTLGISRNTVITAFDQLLAEGYLEGRLGAGTYVASVLPEEPLKPLLTEENKDIQNNLQPNISKRGKLISSIRIGIKDRFGIDSGRPKAFQVCLPAYDDFPFELWGKLVAKHWRYPKYDMLSYGDPGGYYLLRQTLAEYLTKARALRCSPEQIIITSGAHHAFDLVARVLFDPGDSIWMEDPGFRGTRAVFESLGVNLINIPVDEEGLNVSEGISRFAKARAAYITPSHQFPLGVTMSLKRRLALLEWAQTYQSWIIEDDYISEFRYSSRPIAALQGLDNIGCVIYIGTFSKVLLPALRIGYIVVPENLIDVFLNAKALSCRYSNPFEQATLADFMINGHFDQHLRRMLKLYRERQETLVKAIKSESEGLIDITYASSGMHLNAWLPSQTNDQEIAQILEEQNIYSVPISACALSTKCRPGLMLGYTSFNTQEIIENANKLIKIIKSKL